VIFNAGRFPANRLTEGMTSKTSIDLSFEEKQMVILGTEYAGEMKKGVFTIMNYLMPKHGLLSMHCSATADAQKENSSVLFGLSGTGKTTLSADPKRRLIGDDEHVWGDDGIFNIEGGCYAKAIDLTPENEPDIFHALRFGSVLENVVFDDEGHHVDFHDTSITQNTRGAYPIEFIKNAKVPCVAGHPTDIIFLTCDAFGVLPPVSKLTPEQAMYHFISGYTAKVAGTEMGVTEPAATFSACFGAPFLVWHPAKYAELLAEKLTKHKASVWLINTGWSGGSYGLGARIKLKFTRAIIDAIHAGTLASAPTQARPDLRLPHRHGSAQRARGNPHPRAHLGRQESLRRDRGKTRGTVHRELQEVRVRRHRGGQSCGAKSVAPQSVSDPFRTQHGAGWDGRVHAPPHWLQAVPPLTTKLSFPAQIRRGQVLNLATWVRNEMRYLVASHRLPDN
jgi:ATP-dependent phosphoenolpyruvate carboxykinase